MTWAKKKLVLLLLFFIGTPVLELAREEIAYVSITNRLEISYTQLKPDMTKQDVARLAGKPDSVKGEDGREYWYWDAANHQGTLWRILGLAPEKGHETLVVEFNAEGKTAMTWGGIN